VADTKDLKSLALSRAPEAWAAGQYAARVAWMHQKVHYSLTSLAVAAGAVAATTAALAGNVLHIVAAAAAGVATLASAVLGGLKSGNKAATQWTRKADFEALSQRYENQAAASAEPSLEIMDELAREWQRINRLGADDQ
jgi:hypothetical protein